VLDRIALPGAAFSGRLRLFRGIMILMARGFALVRRVLMVLALVMFLSGAFGHFRSLGYP